jgi:hypothetical protein
MATSSMAKSSASGEGAWTSTGLEVLETRDFSSGRLSRPGTYVVCFGAAWCPVTRRFMPRFIVLNHQLPATLAVADITDLANPLWDDFRIRITPSIVVFRDGETLFRIDGRRFLGITKTSLAKLPELLAAR